MKVLLAAAGALVLSAVTAEAGNRDCCPRSQVYVRPVVTYVPVVRYQRYVVRTYCIRFSGYKR